MSTKRSHRLFVCLLALAICLPGCSPQISAQTTQIETSLPVQAATATSLPAMATNLPATASSPPATATSPKPTGAELQTPATPGVEGYPLSAPGAYFVGRRNYELMDTSRDNRPVSIIVWYPALLSEGSTGSVPMRDAAPDFSEAPYPVILSTTKLAGIFAQLLVSHGFTWVSVSGLDTFNPWDENLILQPLDILFALDQVASSPPEGLEGMLDTDHAGATGYSYDGYNALALGGARIDPAFYLAACESDPGEKSEPVPMGSWVCAPAGHWADFIALAGGERTTSEDGLWLPMTDERIKAVVPLAGEGWWLYGEKGLAAVETPTLLIVGGIDFYVPENQQILNHLGADAKALISIVGMGHMMIYEKEIVARMAHLMTAFFGYHLQGREDLASYVSQEFVNQHPDLTWESPVGD